MKASVRIVGDILEIKLRDSSFTPYFEKTAHINSQREMEELFDALREKGVEPPKKKVDWLE